MCVELEEKFVNLGKQNFELNRKAFEVGHFGHSYQPVIIQGDSRKLSEVIAGADIVVGSPPFGASLESKDTAFREKSTPGRTNKCSDYGQTPGQLGSMKPGSVEAIISSPPYAETPVEQTHMTSNKRGDKSDPNYRPSWKKKLKDGYAKTTRPYGKASGNLGNLKPGEVAAVISSPPYEGSVSSEKCGIDFSKTKRDGDIRHHSPSGQGKVPFEYGKSEGQLGNDKGDTFWQAAKQIVAECHKILRPGGFAIWVVKSFVRKGKIVDFPGDWRRLCEAEGFETLHEHHAMLVKETTHNGLFEDITVKKERKSFFRRLAESKGSPAIDYETVYCMRKREKS